MPRAQNTDVTLEAFCPHCFLLIESDVGPDWPPEPRRCPHCRLLIGEGRGKPTADASPGARGTAAGVFAHRAKRDDSETASPEKVCEAIRTKSRTPVMMLTVRGEEEDLVREIGRASCRERV